MRLFGPPYIDRATPLGQTVGDDVLSVWGARAGEHRPLVARRQTEGYQCPQLELTSSDPLAVHSQTFGRTRRARSAWCSTAGYRNDTEEIVADSKVERPTAEPFDDIALVSQTTVCETTDTCSVRGAPVGA